MAALVDTYANNMLNKILGVPLASGGLWPPTVYVGLLLATPNNDGSGVSEPGGGSYARVAVANNSTEWPAATGRSKTHANDILFPPATANWGTIVAVGFFDAAAGGNLLGFGNLNTSRPVNNTDEFRFLAGFSPITLTLP